MIELKTIKTSIKKQKKQKKMNQIEIIIIIEKKTIKDKIESHKNFDKRAKDQNKKLKVEGLD
jgi:hypothetical protein